MSGGLEITMAERVDWSLRCTEFDDNWSLREESLENLIFIARGKKIPRDKVCASRSYLWEGPSRQFLTSRRQLQAVVRENLRFSA